MRDSPPANGFDRVMTILSSAQRRVLLRYLLDGTNTSTAFNDLVQSIDIEGVDDELWEIELHHWHLPMLDETRLIDYSPRSGVVQPMPALEEIAPLLEVCEELEDTFNER